MIVPRDGRLRSAVSDVADDIVARYAGLDAVDEPEAYRHAHVDLIETILDSLDESAVRWLETRRIGALR